MSSKKQAQRTKGNLRPSSSGRAAELLASSGGTVPGFLGFTGLSGDLGYVPVPTSEDIDTDTDSDFRMVMRKFSKKDVITKIKALQEFESLCKQKSVDCVKTTLQYWPRLYNKLILDHDKRVRELTQKAFEQLVLKVERSIAPHLKLLMGGWLVAQNDTYAPAASSAVAAFNAAFSPAKQADAVMFCREEVLAYLSDNLLNQTMQTLSDSKITSAEDMESKYHRVIMSSLLALKMFIHLVPPDKRSLVEHLYEKVLSNGKFWKLLKLPNSMIAGAFFSLIATVCEDEPRLANKWDSKICPAVLHNLDMTKPAVCASLWQAVFLVIITVENCWQHVNLRKAVIPKLWTVLTSGGEGSAACIFPHLLPFLSKLPTEVKTAEFYNLLFNHLKTGLLKDRVLMSQSDCSAVVTSYLECLQYYICHDCPVDDVRTLQTLLKDHLVSTLSLSFTSQKPTLAHSTLYQRCALFINFFIKQSEESSGCCKAQLVTDTFWKELCILFDEALYCNKGSSLDRMSLFMLCLKTGLSHKGPKAKSGKASRLRFLDQSRDNDSPPTIIHVETQKPTDDWKIESNDQYRKLALDTCLASFQNARKESSVSHLRLLSSLLESLPSDHLYAALLGAAGENVADSCPPSLQLCLKVFVPWLISLQESIEIFKEFAQCLLRLMHKVIAGESEESKLELLTMICKNVNNTRLFQIYAELVLTSTDAGIKESVKSDEFGVRLTEFVTTFCQSLHSGKHSQGSDEDWDLLKVALTTNEKGDTVINSKHLTAIISQVQHTLPQSSSSSVDHCVMSVCRITQIIISTVQRLEFVTSAKSLIVELMKFDLEGNATLVDDTRRQLESTWMLGVESFVRQSGGSLLDAGFLIDVADVIRYCLLNHLDTVSRLNSLVTTCIKLGDVITKTLTEEACPGLNFGLTTCLFMRSLMVKPDDTPLEQWFEGPVMSGALAFNVRSKNSSASHSSSLSAGMVAAFNLSLLQKCVTDEEVCELWVNTVLDGCYWKSLCSAVKPAHKQVSYSEVEDLATILSDKIRLALISATPGGTQVKSLMESAIQRSVERGGAWCMVPSYLLSYDVYKNVDIFNRLGGFDRVSSLSPPVLNSFLCNVSKFDDSTKEQLAELSAGKMISLESKQVSTFEGGLGCLSLLTSLVNYAPASVICCVMSELRVWRDEMDELFLFCNTLDDSSEPVAAFNSEVMLFFSKSIHHKASQLTAQDWDFILCNTVSWCQTCPQSTESLLTSFHAQVFLVRLSQLVKCIADFMSSARQDSPVNLMTEWEEFFSEGIFSVLFPLFIQLAENVQDSYGYMSMMQYCGEAVRHCPVKLLLSHQLPAKLEAGDDSNLPDNMQSLMNHLAPLLLSNLSAVQLTAFHLLHRILPELVKFDDVKVINDEEDKSRSPPTALMTTLNTSFHVVDHILTGISVGESMVIEPNIDEYTLTTAYLLSWQLLLGYFKAASSELRVEYATYLHKSGNVGSLMNNAFCLMPESSQCKRVMISQNPDMTPSVETTVTWAQHLACHTCYQTMRFLPALIRLWWNNLDKNAAAYCNGYISKNISPVLILSEIEAVNSQETKYDNMTIKALAGVGEVVASYTVEECCIELVVKLSTNHPLTPVTVECSKRLGVAQAQWRKWMLQLTAFLTHQNGSLVNGLALWKRNLDKHFSGVEGCMICFSVIHGSNYHLPKLQCKTCKKKFHSACLYKWFNTSHNSTCPLCRNLF